MLQIAHQGRRADTDLIGVALALIVGAVLLFGAGFAQSDTLHGATHDTRHVTGFPCH